MSRAAAASIQGDLFGAPADLPEGFRYEAELLSPDEERALQAELERLPFQPFDFYGYKANREVVSFGSRYDYGARTIAEAPEIPAFLLPLRARVGAWAGKAPDAFQQVLVNSYRPGAGIGWHRDRPHYDEVVGVSLGAACTFRLRRRDGEGWARRSLTVEPRSVYLLSGPARREWEHSIPEVAVQRWSITFRTLKA
jgi:alkylated DNA repair dioxygenase AlkB